MRQRSLASASGARLRRLILSVTWLSTTGCGARQVRNPFLAERELIRVEVDNRNFNDATIFAQSASGSHRLGVVTGKTSGSFDLRWQRDSQLRLRVVLLAGARFTTRSIFARPGDLLSLTITPNLRRTIVKR